MSERVVAWACDKEWLKVYRDLFYGSVQDQNDALDLINVWRLRFSSKFPVAIEATLRLFQCWLECPFVNEGAQRQLMSAAVTQFVGLLTEKGLKGNTRKPIHHVGEDLGIPEWLINLRHEMAHGPLPSLPMLQKAVDFAINWLKDNHWDVQAEKILSSQKISKTPPQSVTETTSTDNHRIKRQDEILHSLLKEFLFFIVQGDLKRYKPETIQVVNKLQSLITKKIITVDSLCTVLVNKAFLFYLMRTRACADEETNTASDHHFKSWKPMLDLIKQHRKLVMLLCCLINCQLNDDVCNGYVSCWAHYILEQVVKEGNELSKEDHNSLIQCLTHFILNCNFSISNASFYNLVVEKLDNLLNPNLIDGLNKVFSIKFSNRNDDDELPRPNTDGSIYTVNDIKIPIPRKVKIMNGWSLCDDIFSDTMIGLLPGQTLTSLAEKSNKSQLDNHLLVDGIVSSEEQFCSPKKKRKSSNCLKRASSTNVVMLPNKPASVFSSFSCMDWKIAKTEISLL